MLIDDNEIDLFINEKTIESLKFDNLIKRFNMATDALNYLKLIKDTDINNSFVPQLILLDINMPFMDGFDFLEEFDKLQLFKQPPIIIFMLSSSLSQAEINQAKGNRNVSGFIQKPLTTDKLITQFKLIRQAENTDT